MGASETRSKAEPAFEARGDRVAAMVLLAVALGLALWHMARFTVVLDDSYIAFRAASNWAQTGVPEYNQGIREWVPTSFLWVALVAIGAKLLPFVECRTIAQFLGGLIGIASILLLAVGLPRRRAGAAAALLCAGSAVWAAWPLSGMDTVLFTASVVAGVCILLRLVDTPARSKAVLAGVTFGVMSIIRPDGVVFSAAAAATVAVCVRDRAMLGWLGLGYGIAIAPVILYLSVVFGTIVPVSYYAKVHGLSNVDRGIQYLLGGIQTYRLYGALPVVAIALWDPRHRRSTIVLLFMLAAWTAWVIIGGGDFLPYHRFLTPVWPVVAVLCGFGLEASVDRLEHWRPGLVIAARVFLGLVLLATAVAWTLPSVRGADRARYDANRIDEEMREAIGRYFAGKLAPSEWIAVKPAGIVPYYSRARAIDFFCLTDRKAAREASWVPGAWIGHQSVNAARIHEVSPKIVILEARLFPLASMPPPWQTDPNHGGGWLSHPAASRYSPVRAEIVRGYWLGFFILN